MIYDTPPIIEYTGDGVTVAFAYPFRIFAGSNLLVTVDDVVQTNRTITGIDNTLGGVVTLPAAPAVGAAVVITRDVPLSRIVDFVDGGDFRALVFNGEFDRQVANIQEVAQRIEDLDIPELPDPVPGRQLSYNAAGEIVVSAYNGDETRVIADGAVDLSEANTAAIAALQAAIDLIEADTVVRPDPVDFTLVVGQTDYDLPSHWPINVTAPQAYQLFVDGVRVAHADYSLVGSEGRTVRLANAPVSVPDGVAFGAGSTLTVYLVAGVLPASAVGDGSITASKFAAGAVTAPAIATGAVVTAAIQDLAVTAVKEADGTAKAVRVYNGSGRPAAVTGAAGQYLGFDGTGTPSAVDPPVIPPQTGGLIRVVVDNVAGTRNYVKSASAVWTVVELAGGGGGGAYGVASATDVGGGPGGGPGYCMAVFDSTALAASVAYTVGAGGTAGTSSSESGGVGGASIFSTARANGGAGGTRPAPPGIGLVTSSGGGAGGTATGGSINDTGASGRALNLYDANLNAWAMGLNMPGEGARSGRGGPGGTSGTRTGSVGRVVIWEFK